MEILEESLGMPDVQPWIIWQLKHVHSQCWLLASHNAKFKNICSIPLICKHMQQDTQSIYSKWDTCGVYCCYRLSLFIGLGTKATCLEKRKWQKNTLIMKQRIRQNPVEMSRAFWSHPVLLSIRARCHSSRNVTCWDVTLSRGRLIITTSLAVSTSPCPNHSNPLSPITTSPPLSVTSLCCYF